MHEGAPFAGIFALTTARDNDPGDQECEIGNIDEGCRLCSTAHFSIGAKRGKLGNIDERGRLRNVAHSSMATESVKLRNINVEVGCATWRTLPRRKRASNISDIYKGGRLHSAAQSSKATESVKLQATLTREAGCAAWRTAHSPTASKSVEIRSTDEKGRGVAHSSTMTKSVEHKRH